MTTVAPSSKPPRPKYDWDRPPAHPFQKRRRRNRTIALGFTVAAMALCIAVAGELIEIPEVVKHWPMLISL